MMVISEKNTRTFQVINCGQLVWFCMSFVPKLDLKVGHFESFLRVKLSENFTKFDKIFRNWN